MNHRRFTLFRALAALLTAAALTACGGSDGPAPEAPGPDPSSPGPVTRVDISPAGGMLVDTAERRSITVKAFDAIGAEVPLAADDVKLASSDAAGIEVSRAGDGFEVRAAVLPRSANLTASVSPPLEWSSARSAWQGESAAVVLGTSPLLRNARGVLALSSNQLAIVADNAMLNATLP